MKNLKSQQASLWNANLRDKSNEERCDPLGSVLCLGEARFRPNKLIHPSIQCIEFSSTLPGMFFGIIINTAPI